MFLFLRLLLAHFIADFPLQFSRLFALKLKGIKGIIIHGSVFALLAFIFSLPYLMQPFFIFFILFLWISHIAIDWLKINFTQRHNCDNMLFFLLDQLLHIVLIGLIVPLSPSLIPVLEFPGMIAKLYYANALIILLILYIITAFGGTVFIYYLKKAFINDKISFPQNERYYGVLSRAGIITLLVAPYNLYLFVPLVLGLEFFICYRHRFTENKYDYSLFNFISSASMAIICGLILKICLL